MKLIVKKGRTSLLVKLFIQDSTSTTGAGKTGLTNSSLTAYTARDDDGNAGGTSISLASATRGTWTSAGFIEKDATNMPGVYEFGVPNAAIASGSETAVIMLKGTGVAPVVLEIQLVAYDPQDSVRQGMTALPNAAAEASGGLYTRGSGAGQITQDANGRINTNLVAIDAQATTGNNATLNLKQLNIVNSAGDAIVASATGSNGNGVNASGNGTGRGFKLTGGAIGAALELIGGGTSGAGLKATTTDGHGFDIAATGASKHGITATGGNSGTCDGIKAVAGTGGVDFRANMTGNVTGNLSGTVGSVTGAVGSVTGNVGGNVSGNVAGSVASVTGNVGGNVSGTVASVVGNLGGNVSGDVLGSVAALASGAIARASFAAETGLRSARSNTAQAGAAGSVTLDASASAVDDFYKAQVVHITGGTGAGQARYVTGYVGSTKVASVSPNWATNPDNTSTFAVMPWMSSLDDIVEAPYSLRRLTKAVAAATAGKSSGLDTSTAIYRDANDGRDAITATVDVSGNRSAVTLNI